MRYILLLCLLPMSWIFHDMGSFASPPRIRLMTWNVENLFDTIHDEGFHDEEFLPESDRRWTSWRYWHKMNEIARAIAAVGEDGLLPDLIGLCEVENDSVLTTLTRRSLLRHLGYDYVMTHSDHNRGVDVALLYQPMNFSMLEHRDIRVPSRENGLPATRNILHVKGIVIKHGAHDTLHVLVVHLPSRISGHQGDLNRQLAAKTLGDVVDSLKQERVVVMGDFNAGRRDGIFKLIPLMITDDVSDGGTYCYHGMWQWLDHVLVSPTVKTTGSARPVRLPWLMTKDETYDCDIPHRTYIGPSYKGGVSDHLPLVLDLE